jgi:uncharacterized membrane protein YoaK (UPF0700 family)
MPFHQRKLVTIEITPEGEIRQPERPPLAMRIALIAAVVALIAGAIAAAALALWVALALIPVAAIAAVVAYLAFRFQLWRSRRSFRGGDHFPV